jgi:GNAT superfamily N-acetyltransferase
MYSATFIFDKKDFDEDFHRLDAEIAEAARRSTGYLGEEAWEDPRTGRCCNVYYWSDELGLRELIAHPRHQAAKAAQARWLSLRDKRSRSDSQLWVAAHPGTGGLVGFCQCYPSFCSLTPGPLRILSDLFVQSSARRSGAGRALLRAAALDAQRQGCVRLELTTAHDNLRAQALYTSEGWQHDEVFRTYTLTLALALE